MGGAKRIDLVPGFALKVLFFKVALAGVTLTGVGLTRVASAGVALMSVDSAAASLDCGGVMGADEVGKTTVI